LAELARRDLVPELSIASLDDRALRERLRRRMHLVRMRASAMNRIFGLLRQWGPAAIVAPAARSRCHGTSPTTRHARRLAALDPEALAVIELLDARIAPLDHELGPLARADARVVLRDTIPGTGTLLGLTLASEFVASGGDVCVGAEARVSVIGRYAISHDTTVRATGCGCGRDLISLGRFPRGVVASRRRWTSTSASGPAGR
jgi:hypothetical protein